MTQEKVARLAAGTITFTPLGEQEPLVLGYNQKVSISRNAEKKELLSNDNYIGETVAEIETKVTYELSTEIGDLSLKNLSLCFKGKVQEVTYKKGSEFWNGKIIKADTENSFEIGDYVLSNDRIYIVTNAHTNPLKKDKCAPKTYPAVTFEVLPETRTHNIGTLVIEGKNLASAKSQTIVIPKINLSFDGDFTAIGDDFVKLALKGKLIKDGDKPLFKIIEEKGE